MRYIEAKNLAESLKSLDNDSSITPLAGGTDLIIQYRDGRHVGGFLDITRLTHLSGIIEKNGWITIGPLTTHTEIADNPIINKFLPALSRASSKVGSIAIRNKGTIGGNIMNASPAADTVPALLAYDASLIFESKDGVREISINDFYLGYKKLNCEKNELLTKIIIPPSKPAEISGFYKLGNRKSVSISKVNACFRIKINNNVVELIRIVFGSVAPVPIRLKTLEDKLIGKQLDSSLIENLLNDLNDLITPINDVRSTKDYRLHIAKYWLKDFLELGPKE